MYAFLLYSQVFCPIAQMDHLKDKEVSLAGYVFIKFGYNLEWQKSWILLENRTLYYTDKVYTIFACADPEGDRGSGPPSPWKITSYMGFYRN